MRTFFPHNSLMPVPRTRNRQVWVSMLSNTKWGWGQGLVSTGNLSVTRSHSDQMFYLMKVFLCERIRMNGLVRIWLSWICSFQLKESICHKAGAALEKVQPCLRGANEWAAFRGATRRCCSKLSAVVGVQQDTVDTFPLPAVPRALEAQRKACVHGFLAGNMEQGSKLPLEHFTLVLASSMVAFLKRTADLKVTAQFVAWRRDSLELDRLVLFR